MCCPALFGRKRRHRRPHRLRESSGSRGRLTRHNGPAPSRQGAQPVRSRTCDMTDATSERDAARSETIDPNVWSEYDIETHTSLIDRPLRTLKHGDAFAVLDSSGDIGTVQDTAEGLFYRDTRYLSHYELRIEGKRPLLLSSAMHEDKAALSADLTNPDVVSAEHGQLPRDTIFL